MPRKISVIGVPSSAGAFANGQEEAPKALRVAGLIIDRLRSAGADVDDTGDSPVWRCRPDRRRPRTQNLEVVVDQARTTRSTGRRRDARRKDLERCAASVAQAVEPPAERYSTGPSTSS